ncbi:hypothetical protein RRG08_014656 [Elysia crispata]|uniref:Uncharacterized protein n=1 Tax=Elysia crispata TaxID=231223 RepID=A0AAE0YHK6_9GAST|nr:hypothetical protein RRG08_014656 [Elysia crispata]
MHHRSGRPRFPGTNRAVPGNVSTTEPRVYAFISQDIRCYGSFNTVGNFRCTLMPACSASAAVILRSVHVRTISSDIQAESMIMSDGGLLRMSRVLRAGTRLMDSRA